MSKLKSVVKENQPAAKKFSSGKTASPVPT
jgi:hypothetical protein